MLLTQQERDKFALWCEQSAESAKLLVDQMDKLPHAAPLVREFKMEIAACTFIAQKLRSTVEETIR